jgi:hypothetical protein
MNLKVGWYLLLGFVASIASGCASSGRTADHYELIADPPGLKYVSISSSKNELDKEFVESYTWTFSPGGWPAANLMFVRMKDVYRGRYSYVRELSLAEHVDRYFPARKITYGSKGSTKNAVGDLDFLEFGVDTVAACVLIEQGISRFSDQVDLRMGGDPLGDMFIRGWYCAKSSEPNQDALFWKFINSIGIKGYAVPDT